MTLSYCHEVRYRDLALLLTNIGHVTCQVQFYKINALLHGRCRCAPRVAREEA
jgi:hypothetical protein